MNITVIGSGRWGSFISWYLSGMGFSVRIYGRKGSASFAELRNTKRNEYIILPETVSFTDELSDAMAFADTVVISVGAQNFPALMDEIKGVLGGNGDKTYLLCMKGIVEDGGRRLSEVLYETLGEDSKCVAWVGPGHAEDFVRGIPNCMLMASRDEKLASDTADKYSSALIRFYHSTDMIGCEVGAATKNVIGIAAGILDGMGYSSLKGALMARGPREIARLTSAMGGDERSIFGLCHLGDYEATLFSEHSHNRRFGEAFVLGENYGKLAEGVYTVKSLMLLKERYGVDMPICTAVYDVIHCGADPKEVMASLFLRARKSEF